MYQRHIKAVLNPVIRPPFGSCISSRGFSSAAYRYGFNGKEKEADGTADNYDFGARIYDGRLGRWLGVDPLFKFYSEYSHYSFAACDPLNNVDIAGKQIYAVDSKTEAELGTVFNELFISVKNNGKMAALLKSHISTVTHTTNSVDGAETLTTELIPATNISKQEFKKAMKGLSKEQKAVARGYYKLINSDKKAVVQVGNGDEALDPLINIAKDDPNHKTNGTISEYLNAPTAKVKTPGNCVSKDNSKTSDFDFAVVIQSDYDYANRDVSVIEEGYAMYPAYNELTGITEMKPYIEIGNSLNEVISHELVGHGLLGIILHQETNLAALQVSNLVRKTEGKKPRSGEDHQGWYGKDPQDGSGKMITNFTEVQEIPKLLEK
jgi:RHS repeat-associated protein